MFLYLKFVLFIIFWFISSINVNIINAETISNINCPTADYSPLQILSHVTPKGNTSAGVFTKLSQHRNIFTCTQSCCQKTTCHVVFFYNQSCFHISCHNMKLCEPTKRSGKKFAKSSMVLVRSLDDPYSTIADYTETSDDEYNDSKQRREDRVISLIDDYSTSPDTERPLISIKSSDSLCSFGLSECPINELCILSSPRKRQGICVCKTGYTKDAENICQPSVSDSDAEGGASQEESQSVGQSTNTNTINNTTSPSGGSAPTSSTKLVVSAGPNQIIELPKDEVILSAFVLPSSTTYKYEWQLLSHPTSEDIGNMQGSNTDHIKLSHLRAGNYTFKVTVTEKDAIGSTTVNVTVLPPRRINKPPVVLIQPANSTVQLPNKDTVLDGSYSTDDDKIVKYEWQAMTVPIGYKNLQLPSSQTLQLKDLLPGLYQLKLTVTDSDGATNSTIANVTVLKEIDYPPTANAGPDVVLHLPQNEVTLYGNQSTDDKGITAWQWIRAPDENNVKLSVDTEGTSTPFLHLSKLEVGVYKFVLKVTDTSNQTSKAEVHVFVKPENNEPPIANAGENLKVSLPLEHPIVLDGSKSHDDSGISKWLWEEMSGPKQVSILNSNQSRANISKMIPGDYEFRLTVWDSKDVNSSALVSVNVIQAKNLPPVANAGGDRTVTLPVNEVILNGSNSYDDVEIVSYLWQRTPESLAFGDIIDNSTYSPILRLTNLIIGRYLFRLTVTDTQGSTASDVASLIVKPSQDMNDEIEMIINSDIKTFTSDQELTILKRLELLLNEGEAVKVQLIKLDATTHTRRVIMIFIVTKANNKRLSGREVVKQLKQKLKTDSSLISPEIISLRTFICQNECSNHGSCDQYTKRCLCEAFWMEDMIRLYLGDRESNCDWSILYVIVISFTVVVTITALFWTCVCCLTKFKSKKPLKTRKYRKSNRNRYTLLEDDYDNDMTADKIELLTNNVKEINSQTYLSDSQSDTLFDTTHRNNLLNNKLNFSQQKRHQKSLNGLVKDYRKVRA